MGQAVVAPFVDNFVPDANFFRRRRRPVQRHFLALPPRLKTILLRAARHLYGSIGNLARIADAQSRALLVRKRVTIILIERSAAIIAGRAGGKIDTQRERPIGFFTGALHQWLHWHNSSGAHVKRHLVEPRAQAKLFFARQPGVCPESYPFAGGKGYSS